MDSMNNSELSCLLAAIKSGVGADGAFEQLLSRYKPLIIGKVSALFGNHKENAEAVQEASVALHKAALSYDSQNYDGVTFGLFAGVCIHRRLIDMIRRESREREFAEQVENPESISSDVNIESAVAAKDLCDRVMKVAKLELSDFEYEVFRLVFEQYSTKDIAKKLSKTPKSVDNAKNRISRKLSPNREILDILPRF